MALTFVGATSAAGTTAPTVPGMQAGDVIIVSAYRGQNATAITTPAGYTNGPGATANGNADRVAYRIATSSTDATGTWTNADVVVVEVWRGAANPPFGATSSITNITSPFAYPALTLSVTDGSSVVLAFAGIRSLNQEPEVPPPGMVNRVAQLADGGITAELAGHSTPSGVSSWAGGNGGATGGIRWRINTVELLAAPDAAGITGTLTVSDTATDTVTMTGTVSTSGTLAFTENGTDTVSASGTVATSGSLVVSDTGTQALAFTATVSTSGTLAVSDAATDTIAMTGTVATSGITGTLTITDSATDAISASGTLTTTGTVALVDTATDLLAFTGTLSTSGSLTVSDSAVDTITFTGVVGGDDYRNAPPRGTLLVRPRTYALVAQPRNYAMMARPRSYEFGFIGMAGQVFQGNWPDKFVAERFPVTVPWKNLVPDLTAGDIQTVTAGVIMGDVVLTDPAPTYLADDQLTQVVWVSAGARGLCKVRCTINIDDVRRFQAVAAFTIY